MAQYGPELWWYPDETLAVNTAVDVFPRASNIHAAIFSDVAMTIPLANPTSTNGLGFLTFYAQPGDYWLHINGLTFDTTVNDGSDDSWHTTFIHEQLVAATLWTITHDMATRPDVELHNSANTQVIYGEVTFPNATTVQIRFNTPQSGFAYLRR